MTHIDMLKSRRIQDLRSKMTHPKEKKKRCPTATSQGQMCFSKRSWQVKEARKSMFE